MARPSLLPAFPPCPRLDLALALLAGGGLAALAQPPVVEYLFPAGGQRGTVLNVSAGGSPGTAPLQPWSDAPGLHFETGETPGQFRLALAPTVPPGPHLVRFFNAQGCTAPRLVLVGEWPETIELGSPELSGIGEELRTLPITVNGRLRQPGEVDTYRLRLEPSQTLRAELTALGFDSPLAARLTLLDPDGASAGESTNAPAQDPVLVTTIRRAGVHRLLVEPAAQRPATAQPEAAGDARIYRLACALIPPPPVPVLLAGPESAGFELPGLPNTASVLVVQAPAESAERLHPEMLSPTAALPGVFTGFISPVGDEDRFGFLATREEIYRFAARAGSLESPLTPVLRVLDGEGNLLAASAPDPDPTLEWIAPADGAYAIVIADARGEGGPDFRYELETFAPEPRLVAEVDEHTFRLRPGESLSFEVRLLRPETHRGVVTVIASGLPEDVTAGGGVIIPGETATRLHLSASTDARPSNQPFRVLLIDPNAAPPRVVIAQAALRGRYTPPGGLLRNETDALWLTVVPVP
jgi:hypothetical protein